jgi:pyruvate,water dikinase
VRDEMGLTNVQVMVPFVRTLGQARRVTELLAERPQARRERAQAHHDVRGAEQRHPGREFLEYFDGFSIGSNDLTQLTLGLDRDSGLELLAPTSTSATRPSRPCWQAIKACKAQGKYVGICGQGPATTRLRPWLADEGIASISLNPTA